MRQHGRPTRVEQGGQAAGEVVGVRGLHAVGQRHRDQAARGIVAVGGHAGGPVGDLDEAVVGVEGVVRGGGLGVVGDGEGGAVAGQVVAVFDDAGERIGDADHAAQVVVFVGGHAGGVGHCGAAA